MEFKQPKVEFINIQSSQVVFSSYTDAGGTMSCNGNAPGNCQTSTFKEADSNN